MADLGNYHVSAWDMPLPRYLCLLCHETAYYATADLVKQHIANVHHVAGIPSETVPLLLAMRASSDPHPEPYEGSIAPTEEALHGAIG